MLGVESRWKFHCLHCLALAPSFCFALIYWQLGTHFVAGCLLEIFTVAARKADFLRSEKMMAMTTHRIRHL